MNAIEQHRAEEEAVATLRQLHIDDGWDIDTATAFAENGYDRDFVNHMSIEEVMDCYLTWQGIINFTRSIMAVIKNAAKMKPEWVEQTCPWCEKEDQCDEHPNH